MTQAYIVEALRTAGGRRNGALRDWHPVDLGAAVIDALMSKIGIDPAAVEHMTRVPMGSPTRLAMDAGIGEGPWSAALLEKFAVTEFSQFTGAQMIADRYGFTREQLDQFALESHRKAATAMAAGAFDR